jgi:hypothetical protein
LQFSSYLEFLFPKSLSADVSEDKGDLSISNLNILKGQCSQESHIAEGKDAANVNVHNIVPAFEMPTPPMALERLRRLCWQEYAT